MLQGLRLKDTALPINSYWDNFRWTSFTAVAFRLTLLSIVALSLSFASNSHAHSRGESFSLWTIQPEGSADQIIGDQATPHSKIKTNDDSGLGSVHSTTVNFRYSVALKDIRKLSQHFQAETQGWHEKLAQYLAENLELSSGDQRCNLWPDTQRSNTVRDNYYHFTAGFQCSSNSELTLVNNGLFDLDSRHMHIAKIKVSGETVHEKIQLNDDRVWDIFSTSITDDSSTNLSNASALYDYLYVGVEHVATGLDHLAFLTALMMLIIVLSGSKKTIFILVTGFSIGHSFSLVMATFGYVTPSSSVVEAFIAVSIALVALEIAAHQHNNHFELACAASLTLLAFLIFTTRHDVFSAIPAATLLGMILFSFCYLVLSSKTRTIAPQVLMTLFFGCIHGFGFAGSLHDVGLPQERLIPALLGFNLGVESGQLIIIALVFVVFKPLSQYVGLPTRILLIDATTALLCTLGCFWFISRSLF